MIPRELEILMERVAVKLCGGLLESLTCTPKLEMVALVGVPEMTPPVLKRGQQARCRSP